MISLFSRSARSRGEDSVWLLSDVLDMEEIHVRNLDEKDRASLSRLLDRQKDKLKGISKSMRTSPENANYISKLVEDIRKCEKIETWVAAHK